MRTRLAACVLPIALLGGAALASACADDASEEPTAGEPTAAATAAATAPPTVAASFAPPGPATFKVRGGMNDGAIDVEMFMPADVHVREGDSIEWTSSGFEGHTVTFGTQEQIRNIMKSYLQPDPTDPEQQIFNPDFALPRGGKTIDGSGAYVNSGFIGVPVEATYTLTFTKRGVYEYVCIVHPLWMRGTVSVDAPDAQVESADAVATRGAGELEGHMKAARQAMADSEAQRHSVPGPDGTGVHHISTGLTTPYGQVAVYTPATLTIKAGDTVIFENDDRNFHNVIFKGEMAEPPPGYEVFIDPETGGLNVALAKESTLAVDPPPAGFDDRTFISSGSMGPSMPRNRWKLRFDTPGRYLYNCTIHQFAGMSGVIVVEPR